MLNKFVNTGQKSGEFHDTTGIETGASNLSVVTNGIPSESVRVTIVR